jgi:hypothetical protein
MFAQLDKSHALAQAQMPQFASNRVLFEPRGESIGPHGENRFPPSASFLPAFSPKESQFLAILYSKTNFLYDQIMPGQIGTRELERKRSNHEKA